MKLKLWHKVLIGMGLGILGGKFFQPIHCWAKPLADIYTALVKMVVIPTVFCAVVYGLNNVRNISVLGRLSLKASWVYLGFTICAVTLGILVVNYFKPGVDSNVMVGVLNPVSIPVSPSLVELLVRIVPENFVSAMAAGNTLQVVFFAFVFGIALMLTGEQGALARDLVASVTSAVFKMIELVVQLSPLGVFALMVWVVGEYGLVTFFSLGRLAGTILLAFCLQYLVFGLVLCLNRLNPFKFYKKTANIQSISFATASSKASIKTAVEDLQSGLGVSKQTANFVLPLGAALNMSGSAIYIVVCALFVAQASEIHFNFHQYVVLILSSTVGSIGAAGYPSGAVVMLGMVLQTMGLSEAIFPLILGIDRLLDMFRTVVNVTGDCVATVVVDKLEHNLDEERYNG